MLSPTAAIPPHPCMSCSHQSIPLQPFYTADNGSETDLLFSFRLFFPWNQLSNLFDCLIMQTAALAQGKSRIASFTTNTTSTEIKPSGDSVISTKKKISLVVYTIKSDTPLLLQCVLTLINASIDCLRPKDFFSSLKSSCKPKQL